MKGLRLALCILFATLPIYVHAPSGAAEWKDRDCRNGKDDSGNPVQVCRDQESIGIFWDDGSYVNGWCDSREYDVDYKGVSKSDAVSWVKYYCG
jgi:hypothetical protein